MNNWHTGIMPQSERAFLSQTKSPAKSTGWGRGEGEGGGYYQVQVFPSNMQHKNVFLSEWLRKYEWVAFPRKSENGWAYTRTRRVGAQTWHECGTPVLCFKIWANCRGRPHGRVLQPHLRNPLIFIVVEYQSSSYWLSSDRLTQVWGQNDVKGCKCIV